MTLREFFEGIESIAEAILFQPLDGIRALELESWFKANGMSWIFLIIGLVAFTYWMRQLKKFNENEEEDLSQVSHSFLGKNSELERD